jgi:hypothetical protein
MFEPNMDEYLDEEVETLKQVFEDICTGWDREVQYILVFRSLSINPPTSSIYIMQPNPMRNTNTNNNLGSSPPKIQLKSNEMFLHHLHPYCYCL